MTEPIVVSALDRRLQFESLDDLSEHVQELLATRGSVFSPMEIACISELSARANGQAGPDVHRIARSVSVHAPAPPPRGPTPFDDKLQEARATLEERVTALEAAKEHRFQCEDAAEREYREIVAEVQAGKRDALDASDAKAHWRQMTRDAKEEHLRCEDAWRRAHCRVNALEMAASRWSDDQVRKVFLGYDENGERRYGSPAELREWRRNRG